METVAFRASGGYEKLSGFTDALSVAVLNASDALEFTFKTDLASLDGSYEMGIAALLRRVCTPSVRFSPKLAELRWQPVVQPSTECA